MPVEVHSRPSLLYRQLFGSSLGGIVTRYIPLRPDRAVHLFAVIEAIALWMALRLSSQITTSVEELYAATQRVDRGDLRASHPRLCRREPGPTRGTLARSFNGMTGFAGAAADRAAGKGASAERDSPSRRRCRRTCFRITSTTCLRWNSTASAGRRAPSPGTTTTSLSFIIPTIQRAPLAASPALALPSEISAARASPPRC